MNFNMNVAQFQHKLAEMEQENLMLRLQLDVYRDELFKKYESFLDEKLTMEMEKKLSLDVRKVEADMHHRLQEEIKLLEEELQRLRGPGKSEPRLSKVEMPAEARAEALSPSLNAGGALRRSPAAESMECCE